MSATTREKQRERNGNLKLQLRKSDERYRRLFNEMISAFALHEIICDPSGKPVDYRYLDVNPAFEKVTGLKSCDILHKTVLEVLPRTEGYWIERYGRVALTGEPILFENYSVELDKYFEVRAYCPEPGKFACMFNDITQRKKAEHTSRQSKQKLKTLQKEFIKERETHERQLRQTQKMEAIGALAGGIAHDFNNILFPLVGYAEILLEDLPAESDLIDPVIEILKASERARDLVKQILTFSRQAEKDIRPLRVQIILREIMKLIRSSLPSTIVVGKDIDGDCGTILADPTHIYQIIMNLVTNSFHAMEENGGVLNISLRQVVFPEIGRFSLKLPPGTYARLTVTDTGMGIAAKNMEKIFDPYFTTKDKEKGTGLGLAVVHGIVKSYQGEIFVESTPGKGTQFEIYLPVSDVEPEIDPDGIAPDIETGDERILLVDDEEQVLILEKQILDRLGYRVNPQISSLEALALFSGNPYAFDLVITDITMPGMTGEQLSRRLLRIRPDIPIIACTGFSEKMTPEKAAAIGIRGFLMKPALSRELAGMIRKILDVRKDPPV